MSIITLQVGQCGNQIGTAFFDQLIENICDEEQKSDANFYAICSPYIREKVIDTYFERNSKNNLLSAKAILLDMEPKVIQKCLDSRN